ncbi:hypothetical protein H312_03577, partial [Anncaliia algerae PRA339]
KYYKKLSLQSHHILKLLGRNKIGGFGHVVEIDESKFIKLKYNVGRLVRSPWIVRGIDLTTNQIFFVEVLKRDKERLENIIKEYLYEGTTIVIDCWGSYINLEPLGYYQFQVNHTENFINPLTGANTQTIENRWSIIKRKFRDRYIKSSSDLSLSFSEFLYKTYHKNNGFDFIMRNLNKFID